jgi:hypothetical protein
VKAKLMQHAEAQPVLDASSRQPAEPAVLADRPPTPAAPHADSLASNGIKQSQRGQQGDSSADYEQQALMSAAQRQQKQQTQAQACSLPGQRLKHAHASTSAAQDKWQQ